jgi:arylsulfatase A-like enzyme
MDSSFRTLHTARDITEMRRHPLAFAIVAAFCTAAFSQLPANAQAEPHKPAGERPNILVIMADDLGFSDLGCYGSEIETPNIDSLASEGIRMRSFYNMAKCVPSRRSLLSGLDPTKAKAGVCFARLLREADYFTAMVGKWHNGYGAPWDEDNFAHFMGFSGGGVADYFEMPPTRSYLDGKPFTSSGVYVTDLLTNFGLAYIEEAVRTNKPFLIYQAYNAPHYPLGAKKEDLAKYRDTYLKGWDYYRAQRLERQKELGLFAESVELSPRPSKKRQKDRVVFSPVPAWSSLSVEQQREEAAAMATYAAMVDNLDQNVGRLLQKLRDLGVERTTLVLFFSDNGACAVDKKHYGPAWANLSNTPYRLYKRYHHQGGSNAPLIARWPDVITDRNSIKHQVIQIVDVPATILDIAGVAYPGQAVPPAAGVSLMPVFRGSEAPLHDVIYAEFEGAKMVRQGRWKLVSEDKKTPWELYDLTNDPTELHDLSDAMPAKAAELVELYESWAASR